MYTFCNQEKTKAMINFKAMTAVGVAAASWCFKDALVVGLRALYAASHLVFLQPYEHKNNIILVLG